MRVLLDTHVWVWWLSGSSRLVARESAALSTLAAEGRVAVASISLWEVQMAFAKGRFRPVDPFDTWLRMATARDVVSIIPIDVDVVLQLNDFPAAFHADPADRLIVATARAHGLLLATHDRAVRRARMVKLWKP